MTTLYGPDNRPITPQKDELAFGVGRATIAEQFPHWQNPDEIARSKGLAYYDEIAKDPHVASVLQTRILTVLGCPREIRPATDNRADRQIADFLTWNLQEYLKPRGGLDAIAEQILRSSFKNGYGVQEILWNPRHAQGVVADDVRDRDPDRFLLTPAGDYLKAHVFDLTGVQLPPRKFIVSSFQPEYENRYGTSLFVSIHWYTWFKKNGLKFWLVFLEKFGMPTVKGTYPSGATLDEQHRLQEALESIQNRTSLVVPEGFQAELMEASRAGSTDGYLQLLQVCNREISKAILGQTLTTEEGMQTGSLAQAHVHGDVRGDILIADGKWLDRQLNWTLLTWLTDYNFDVAAYPYLVTQTAPGEDLKAEAEVDEKLVNLGVRLAQSYFYAKYNRPEPKPGEPLVTPAAVAGVGAQGFAPTAPAAFAETPTPPRPSTPLRERGGVGSFAEQHTVPTDPLFEQSLPAGTDVYQTLLDPIRQALHKSEDETAFTAALKGLKSDVQPLAEYLQRVMVTAHLLGRDVMRQRITSTTPLPPPESGGGQGAVDVAEVDASVTIDPLTMDAAVEFIQAKQIMSSAAFKQLRDAAKRSAFAIADVEDQRVVGLVRDELTKALEEGTTFADFKAAVETIFDNYGVTAANPFHLETIFRTNIQSAYQQGAHDLLYDSDVDDLVEFLEYSAVDDRRTRPEHAAWNGVTLPKDDPWWSTHWPPNGYNCRCDVIPVTKYEVQRKNISATATIPPGEPDIGFRSAPALPTQTDLQ